VLTNLTEIAEILGIYREGLQQTLVILPAGINGLQSAVYNTPVPSAMKLNFKAVVNDSPPCTTGFTGDRQRDPNDLSPAPPAVDAYCKEPASSPIGVRMGRNAPCPNNPAIRSRTASGCGLDFQTPADALQARQEAVRTQLEVAGENPTSKERPETATPPDPGGVEARPSAGAAGR
jgi:phospholipid/cholesterol/gamma-HCH transport system substrate-binding protein